MVLTKGKRRGKGVVTNTNGAYGVAKRKTLHQLAKEQRQMLAQRREILKALPSETRAAVNAMVASHGGPSDEAQDEVHFDLGAGAMDWEDDDDVGISADGGEYDDAVRAAHQHIIIPHTVQPTSRYRRDRLRALYRNWDEQIPALAAAYLHWKYERPLAPTEGPDIESSEFDVLAIHTHKSEMQAIPRSGGELANISLMRCGLLGTAPVHPTIAISLHTLELYHRLRRRHARLSIQAFARAICDLHDVNYRTAFREQLSAAFDVYLHVLRTVERRVNAALGRDSANWRIQNACACCDYKLENEAVLSPAKLMAMDGNNSVKRIRNAGNEDERVFHSDYFLSREDVDKFKDEVKHHSPRVRKDDDDDESEDDAPWVPEERPSEATEDTSENRDHNKCTERWKASAAEHHKRALDIYDATGMFASACRHGFIQIVCEMVRSGELAKYPLAVSNHVIDTECDDLGMGLDNGCRLKSTIKKSKLLGPKAQQHNFRLSVNSFHGYAHSRTCQLDNHPLYLKGWGIEDLEGMERVFSASNAVACTIRYATHYHWHQAIDLHFRQWDDDKYSELSRFLLNNYRQCLGIIAENVPEIEKMKVSLNLSDDDFERWIQEERTFLHSLTDEPEERALECAYVEALEARMKADAKYKSAMQLFVNDSGRETYSSQASQTRRLEGRRRAATDELLVAMRAVQVLQDKLGIEHEWLPEDPQYKDVVRYCRRRDFHRALDRVEFLVVQRLFELSKANIAGMGYKMRTSIWKALKKRGKAIRNALKRYNTLATQLDPPAPFLQWKDVVNYAFVSEFDILRHSYSRSDVTSRPWALQANRELTSRYFKVIRAREEILRLNIETARLYTAMHDERRLFEAVVRKVEAGNETQGGDAALAAEIRSLLNTRLRVNRIHQRRIQAIWDLPGYTGSRERGIRSQSEVVGQLATNSASDIDPSGLTAVTPDELHDAIPEGSNEALYDELDDGMQEQLHSLGDFMENLEVGRDDDIDDVPRTRQGIPLNMVSSFRL